VDCHDPAVEDMRIAAAFRAVRIRRRLRQSDVADRARVHRSTVSRVERGHFGSLSLDTIREIASVLDVRVELLPRWRGSDLDRLLNVAHSALHESVSSFFSSIAGWEIVPEVSFSIYGERGVIDILAWHVATRSLLVIELKTAIVDVQELVGTFDRKMRLAIRVARERGWDPMKVSG
jgi:transcriptional regulator with XRE-family HTH domain